MNEEMIREEGTDIVEEEIWGRGGKRLYKFDRTPHRILVTVKIVCMAAAVLLMCFKLWGWAVAVLLIWGMIEIIGAMASGHGTKYHFHRDA